MLGVCTLEPGRLKQQCQACVAKKDCDILEKKLPAH